MQKNIVIFILALCLSLWVIPSVLSESWENLTQQGYTITEITINSFVPAKVLDVSGNLIGSTPLNFRTGYVAWDYNENRYPVKTTPGYEILITAGEEQGTIYDKWKNLYVAGQIVADGYKPLKFQELIAELGRDKNDQTVNKKVTLKPYLEKLSDYTNQPQQQQQTVNGQGVGNTSLNDCIKECKKMYLKGELKSTIEECYKLLCE